ncbi:TniB family NTP-binding protein [Chitinimonas viridis]|uniref:TniB family NTP-binding protein n=1 Tax=Chitinimonas viridis TaxID=664880 RepID=A0ABT8B1Z7_9NEIS|nr:TniB family NTP-binding protein [Chitinimonas viridis]MDN3575696.1 TniB family NTP-binding protein [Chitinimonas viridis]
MSRLRAFRGIAASPLLFPALQITFSRINSVLEAYRRIGLVQNLVIAGETGVGKSTLAAALLRAHPLQRTQECDVRPIVYASVPPSGTIGAIASAILEGLGDPSPFNGTTAGKAYRIKVLMRGCRVQMLLLDEAQHLYDRGKYQSRFLAGDWVKALADALGIPVVLFGLPRLAELLGVNDQLRRRFTEVMQMGPPPSDGVEGWEACFRLFSGFAEAAGVDLDFAGGAWSEWAERLWYASMGRVGYLHELMLGVLVTRQEPGSLVITLDDLAKAFLSRVWSASPARLNPFSAEFDFRKLDRPGEPFGPEVGKGGSHRREAA